MDSKNVIAIKAIKILVLVCLVVFFGLTLFSCGNPPPSITVISRMPPEDLNIVLIINDEIQRRGMRSETVWEVWHRFEYCCCFGATNIKNATLRITADDETFEININTEVFRDFNSIVTLDIGNRIIISGKVLSRSIFLISFRVVLLIAVAGILFCWFGYRKKSSWIAFAIISLFGELIINIFIDRYRIYPPWFFTGVFFGWTVIFVLRAIAMRITINEYDKSKTFLYSFVSGCVNIFLIWLLITFLPF